MSFGTIRTRDYGSFLADNEAFNLIIANFADIGNDMVIDYEHSTLSGCEAPAAGWIKKLIKAGCDLWAVVDWTDKAKAETLTFRQKDYMNPSGVSQSAELIKRITALEQRFADRAITVVDPLKNLPDGNVIYRGGLTPEMRQIGALFGNSDEDLKANLQEF